MLVCPSNNWLIELAFLAFCGFSDVCWQWQQTEIKLTSVISHYATIDAPQHGDRIVTIDCCDVTTRYI